MFIDTYQNQQFCLDKPKKSVTTLPSQFQIGDAIDFFASEESSKYDKAFVYAVKFGANGTVSYDLAIETSANHYAIINNIRGGMRLTGSSNEPSTLYSISEIAPPLRRTQFKLINCEQEKK
ncbi:MAG: hypothetical protein ACD_84C00039G0005 [uncultured bacterium]|nr:MAG: hypothetical protein ACD_84C00039G0005 [uncultured bacterium]